MGKEVVVEKSLQNLIEANALAMLGVRLLRSEYSTGSTHGGRIDSLGMDENGSPVIIEYKRSQNDSVINQGLFYLDWLMDHRAEFQLLVQDALGANAAKQIDWRHPRVMCIAGNFTRYDEHAVKQIGRNMALVRYKRFGDELLLLETVNPMPANGSGGANAGKGTPTSKLKQSGQSVVEESLAKASAEMQDWFHLLEDFALSLGDDVQKRVLKVYIAYARLKNFACFGVYPQAKTIIVTLKLSPLTIQLEEGFSRDVSKIGHYGTGDLELAIRSAGDVERAKPLIQASYEAN